MSKAISLTRRLVLEDAMRVSDGAGGFTETWNAVGELWAEITPGSGRERFGQEVTVSQVPYRIVVRGAPVGAPSRPRAEQRLRDETRIFRIIGVTEYDRDARYLTCFAIEEVAG
ncbi:head-tail adaptor protein [Litoreibacter roseus]|uniref:Tail protein n=1 Tax=Litoreibacter roseus TaxID=2601869 RepID=A0A6N6JMZ1_9RHOB|nr:head-tail adaptor protein [Litoreibacter roseus]GFE66708.1 tail protein [Litoreibacter roseus]